MLTRHAEQTHQQQEKRVAKAALQKKVDEARFKRQEEKEKRDTKCKQEEEQQKLAEDEKRKAEEAATATATAIMSPSNLMDMDTADSAINNHLADMIQGNQK